MFTFSEERKKLYRQEIDQDLVEILRKKRRNVVEMHDIIMELIVYLVFLYTLLTLTYGHRDPSAWLLRENLRHSLIHEGVAGDIDYTKVINPTTLMVQLLTII